MDFLGRESSSFYQILKCLKTQITLRDSSEMTFDNVRKNKLDENFMKQENINKMSFYMGVLRLPCKPVFTFYFVQERMKGKEPINH